MGPDTEKPVHTEETNGKGRREWLNGRKITVTHHMTARTGCPSRPRRPTDRKQLGCGLRPPDRPEILVCRQTEGKRGLRDSQAGSSSPARPELDEAGEKKLRLFQPRAT